MFEPRLAGEEEEPGLAGEEEEPGKKLGVWITLQAAAGSLQGFPSKHTGCSDTLARAKTKDMHVLHSIIRDALQNKSKHL